MKLRIYLAVIVAVLVAFVVFFSFVPLSVRADWESESLTYSSYFTFTNNASYKTQSTADNITQLVRDAYKIGLFGGAFPIVAGTVYTSEGFQIFAYVVPPQTVSGVSDQTIKPNLNSISVNSEYKLRVSAYKDDGSSFRPAMYYYRLLSNGCWNLITTIPQGEIPILTDSHTIFTTWRVDTDADVGSDSIKTAVPGAYYLYWENTGSSTLDLGNILGAYGRVLNGSTVGGDGYDDGYNAGFDDGYDEGYGQGRTEGFDVGYDVGHDEGYTEGYETGYDDGYETGYDDGFANGVNTGTGLGYTEGYETGYNDGYETGYDDGYDDGYERGEFDASPIVIDVPSVITSVPQSAKAIINNSFGFELFGINIAGLLSVLLIVAIIGFVVRWLMSR